MKHQEEKIFFEMAHKWLHKSVIHIFKKYKLDKQSKILDIGCGNGHMLKKIYEWGYKNLYGCDGYISNPKLNEIASIEQMDLTKKLSYQDKSFDMVLLTEVIEHMENPNAVMKEIHRILKDNGKVIISTPNILNITSRLLFLITGHFMLFTQGDIRYDKFPWHIAPFFPYIFQEVFKKEFNIEAIKYSNRLIPLTNIEIKIHHKLLSNSVIMCVSKK